MFSMLPLSKRRTLKKLIEGYDRKRVNYPGAVSQPGPANKVNGGVNTCRGVVCHSMVGPYAAALGELQKPSRRASWHYSVLKSGVVYAHYPDEAQAWHAGSSFNNSTIGIEHEGGLNPYNEPLTPAQLAASVDLVRWLSRNHGFPLVRRVGLWEHREVSGEPTACPSFRIPWLHYTEEEDEMAKPYFAWADNRLWFVGPGGTANWVTTKEAADKIAQIYGLPNGDATIALSKEAIAGLGGK